MILITHSQVDMSQGTKDQEPTLTEFVVTETYIVPARTREEVQQMIEDDDFKYGMRRHEVHIEVNF